MSVLKTSRSCCHDSLTKGYIYYNNREGPLGTLLHIAVLHQEFDDADMLVKLGADVNAVNSNSEPAFLEALHVLPGDSRLHQLVTPENVNFVYEDGRTALNEAVHQNLWETAHYFIKCGADVNYSVHKPGIDVDVAIYEALFEAEGAEKPPLDLLEKLITSQNCTYRSAVDDC